MSVDDKLRKKFEKKINFWAYSSISFNLKSSEFKKGWALRFYKIALNIKYWIIQLMKNSKGNLRDKNQLLS